VAGAGFVRIPDFRLLLLDIRKRISKLTFTHVVTSLPFASAKAFFEDGRPLLIYCFNSSYCFNVVIGDFGSFPK